MDTMLDGIFDEGFIPRNNIRSLKTRMIFNGNDIARSRRRQGVRVLRGYRLRNPDIARWVGRASQKQRPVRCRTVLQFELLEPL